MIVIKKKTNLMSKCMYKKTNLFKLHTIYIFAFNKQIKKLVKLLFFKFYTKF